MGIDLLTNAYAQYHIPGQEQTFTRGNYRTNEPAREVFARSEPSTAWVDETARAAYAEGGERSQPAARSPLTVKNWTILLIEGCLSILCGLQALFLPGLIGSLALYVIAGWALFTAVSAFMQTQGRGWVQSVIGALAVILFLIVFLNPLRVIHSLLWVVGLYSLIMGILLVVRGFAYNATTAYEPHHFGPAY